MTNWYCCFRLWIQTCIKHLIMTADLVYSRTGVARVGQHEMNFDRINRCFTNKPKDGVPVQRSAVVPARYGLFIARRVKPNQVNLMTTGIYKPGDKFDDKDDAQRTFLQPIRKVFNHDSSLVKPN